MIISTLEKNFGYAMLAVFVVDCFPRVSQTQWRAKLAGTDTNLSTCNSETNTAERDVHLFIPCSSRYCQDVSRGGVEPGKPMEYGGWVGFHKSQPVAGGMKDDGGPKLYSNRTAETVSQADSTQTTRTLLCLPRQ